MDLIRNLAWECIEWTENRSGRVRQDRTGDMTTCRSLSIKENNTFGRGFEI